MAGNLLALWPKLTETERNLINDAMHRYGPGSDIGVILFSSPERVIAILHIYGTTAALALAHKLRELQRAIP
jgi:hypothetical protein